jgi:MFS superfamily sulfate permease-like transporter
MYKRFFPFLTWFKGYTVSDLRTDGLAGLTVALVLIPQSMAYAQLAGLPPYYGLYASFLPPMIASLFGSSRQLATGPVAVVSLMTSASLAPLATAGSEGYIVYAILLALMVGVFQLSLGVLRLGLVVNFLSHPVVNGFTNAAAIIIATSQLSKMFGVNVDNAPHHYETIIKVVQAAVHYTHWPTLAMGVLAFAIMYGLKRLAPRIPNVLVAVVITTVLSWAMNFEHDVTVNISTINSKRAIEMVDKFNAAVNSLPPIAEKRTEITRQVEDAKSRHDLLAALEAEHQDKMLSTKSDLINYDAQIYREEIRNFLFVGAPQTDGALKFFPKDNLPQDIKTDGRIWRIRMGNSPLKLDKIRMTGGGEVVGTVPKGLPAFTIPTIRLNVIGQLFPYAAIISLLGFMEAISIAKAMAGKTGQRLDPNQELIGQGLANILGAIGKSYPTSGSFSRSAVNLQAGAVSGLSSVFTSIAVVIALLFFTPLLYHLPQSVLAAVIMLAVIGLINISGFVHAWKAQKYDGAISIISFVCTLWFAPHLDKGIMVGVSLSLMVFLYKSMRPNVASLARDEDDALRCVTTHGLHECKYISMIRFDGPLFFANSSYLDDQITELMLSRETLKHILIVSNGINDIDASGEETLSLLIDRIRSAGLDISLSGVNEAVMKVIERTHLAAKIGADHLYPTMELAIHAIYDPTHKDGDEPVCPLTVCNLN